MARHRLEKERGTSRLEGAKLKQLAHNKENREEKGCRGCLAPGGETEPKYQKQETALVPRRRHPRYALLLGGKVSRGQWTIG